MIRVLLADDHAMLRQGLRSLLVAESDIEVVGETGDGLAAVSLAETLAPDVLVLDLLMPGLHGLEVVRQVTRRAPRTRVLVLSMHSNEAYVLEALRGGAAGYLIKDASADELVRAVRLVAAGRRYLAADFRDRAIEAWAKGAGAEPADPYETLSPREREVAQLAAEGLGNKEIGQRLFISPRTVEVHRAKVLRKLGLASQTELVRWALQRGLLPEP